MYSDLRSNSIKYIIGEIFKSKENLISIVNEHKEALQNKQLNIMFAEALARYDLSLDLLERDKLIREYKEIDDSLPEWIKKFINKIILNFLDNNQKILELEKLKNLFEIRFVLALYFREEAFENKNESLFKKSHEIFAKLNESMSQHSQEIDEYSQQVFQKCYALLIIDFASYYAGMEQFDDALCILSQREKLENLSIDLHLRIDLFTDVIEQAVKLLQKISTAKDALSKNFIVEKDKQNAQIKGSIEKLEDKWVAILGVFLAASFLAPMMSGLIVKSELNFEQIIQAIAITGLVTACIIKASSMIFNKTDSLKYLDWLRFLAFFALAFIVILLLPVFAFFFKVLIIKFKQWLFIYLFPTNLSIHSTLG